MTKKYGLGLYVVLLAAVLFMPTVLYADFEPSAITIDNASTGNTPQAVPETLDAVIKPTASDTTGITLENYIYVWNNSSTALNDDELGVGGESIPHSDSIVISTDTVTEFANSDGIAWYLHVKTSYSDLPDVGIALSNDTVIGPFTFDNVAPAADISLDASIDGQTAATASGSPVTLLVTGSLADIDMVYVNSSEQFSSATGYDFSDPATKALEYDVIGTGSKTLYTWFEDSVGNKSDAVSFTFEVLAGKSMDPAGELSIEIEGTQEFEISGAGAESYTWTIVDADNINAASTAATVDAAQDGQSAIITGASLGNVKLKAVTAGVDPIYSGTLSIVEKSQTFCLDVDGSGDISANTDGILILRALIGLTGTSLTYKALPLNATRNADEIMAYVETAKGDLFLDVDGSGDISANTDGILILRSLIGLTGTSLTYKALPLNATRNADEIMAYVETARCGQ